MTRTDTDTNLISQLASTIAEEAIKEGILSHACERGEDLADYYLADGDIDYLRGGEEAVAQEELERAVEAEVREYLQARLADFAERWVRDTERSRCDREGAAKALRETSEERFDKLVDEAAAILDAHLVERAETLDRGECLAWNDDRDPDDGPLTDQQYAVARRLDGFLDWGRDPANRRKTDGAEILSWWAEGLGWPNAVVEALDSSLRDPDLSLTRRRTDPDGDSRREDTLRLIHKGWNEVMIAAGAPLFVLDADPLELDVIEDGEEYGARMAIRHLYPTQRTFISAIRTGEPELYEDVDGIQSFTEPAAQIAEEYGLTVVYKNGRRFV